MSVTVDSYYQETEDFLVGVYFNKELGQKLYSTTTNTSAEYNRDVIDFLRENCNKILKEYINLKHKEDKITRAFYLYKEEYIIGLYKNDNDKYKLEIFHPSYLRVSNIEILSEFDKFIYKTNKSRFNLLKPTEYGGLRLAQVDIETPKIDVDINYGKKFRKTHDTIVHKLNNEKHGLYMFYGEPGTGKTNYLKYICHCVPDRKFIFIPSVLIQDIDSPKLFNIMHENKGAVLVCEDAERFIKSREMDENSLVAGILNLSDGILSDCVQSSIIITYNTSRDEVDKALLRKGRLSVEYNFDKLDIDDAQKMVDNLGKKYTVEEPMTLGDIYNLDNKQIVTEEKETTKLGF